MKTNKLLTNLKRRRNSSKESKATKSHHQKSCEIEVLVFLSSHHQRIKWLTRSYFWEANFTAIFKASSLEKLSISRRKMIAHHNSRPKNKMQSLSVQMILWSSTLIFAPKHKSWKLQDLLSPLTINFQIKISRH